MDKKLDQHKKDFQEIIEKYNLSGKDKAEEIARFLTKSENSVVDSHEFAILFSMTETEAETFLSFISKGIQFKEEHIDKNNQ